MSFIRQKLDGVAASVKNTVDKIKVEYNRGKESVKKAYVSRTEKNKKIVATIAGLATNYKRNLDILRAKNTAAQEVEFIEAIEYGEPVQLPTNKCVTTTQALIRSFAATAITTTITNPIDVFMNNYITSNMSMPQTWHAVKNHLFKGYRFYFSSALLRNSLIFGAAPRIQMELEKSGVPSLKSEMMAYGISSVIENTFWAIPATGLIYIRDVSRPDINSFMDVYKKLPTAQLTKSIVNQWWWGNIRNAIFWPAYIMADKAMKHHFVRDEDSHISRCIKQFFIGGTVGAVVSSLSYPANVVMQNLTLHPESAKDLLARKFNEHAGEMAQKFLWKGFSVASMRMFALMGATNLAWAIADKSYEKYIDYAEQEVANHKKCK